MPTANASGARFFTGSYTADAGGSGVGICSFELSPDGTLQRFRTTVVADSPSFVARHPTLPVLYAVAEQADTVAAYTLVDSPVPATGLLLGVPWPTGSGPCHVAVAHDGRFLVVACWGDGSVLCYELNGDGGIVSRADGGAAVDPWQSRISAPRASRAHASLMLPDGRVVTTDMGWDLLRVWSYGPASDNTPASMNLDHEVTLPFASGPRHLARHPSGTVLVVTERSVEVVSLAEQPDGRYAITSRSPAMTGPARPGDAAAEIALSADSRYAYIGVRGSNLISVLLVDDSGGTHPISSISSGGLWPRHHVVTSDHLLVANEQSNEITVFGLVRDSGLPGALVFRLPTGSPTVLIPLPS